MWKTILREKHNFFMIVLLLTVFKMIYGCKLMHRSTLLLPCLCHIYTVSLPQLIKMGDREVLVILSLLFCLIAYSGISLHRSFSYPYNYVPTNFWRLNKLQRLAITKSKISIVYWLSCMILLVWIFLREKKNMQKYL